METLGQVGSFVRWKDWGPGKLTILWMLSLYIAVAYDLTFNTYAVTFMVFLVFAAAQSALGFVLNDWGDRELDRRQFKRNAFTGKSMLESILALTLMAVLAFVTGLPLIMREGFVVLWLAWAATTVAYSLEPLRLKTKGSAGLFVSFVSQWFLPVLITFSAFEVAGGWDMWLLALALTICGMSLELAHQRWDRTRDMLTRADTFAVGLSDEKVDRVYAIVLLLDKLAIGMLVGVVAYALYAIDMPWSTGMAGALVVIYLLLFLGALRGSIRGIQGHEVEDPYYGPPGVHTVAQVLHETLMNFIVPVFLGLAATMRSPLFAFVLGLFLVWRVLLGRADWIWPLRELRVRIGK